MTLGNAKAGTAENLVIPGKTPEGMPALPAGCSGPDYAALRGMNTIVCRADDSRRGYVTITLGAKRAERAPFGVVDAVIILALLLCTGAVLRLALAG